MLQVAPAVTDNVPLTYEPPSPPPPARTSSVTPPPAPPAPQASTVRLVTQLGTVNVPFEVKVVVIVLPGCGCSFNAIVIPPNVLGLVLTLQFNPPKPVAPAVGFKAQAAPTQGVLP